MHVNFPMVFRLLLALNLWNCLLEASTVAESPQGPRSLKDCIVVQSDRLKPNRPAGLEHR
jgi:hypothetical protein